MISELGYSGSFHLLGLGSWALLSILSSCISARLHRNAFSRSRSFPPLPSSSGSWRCIDPPVGCCIQLWHFETQAKLPIEGKARKTAANLEFSEVILWGQQALSFEEWRQCAAKQSVPLKHDVQLKRTHSEMLHSVAITNAANRCLVLCNETVIVYYENHTKDIAWAERRYLCCETAGICTRNNDCALTGWLIFRDILVYLHLPLAGNCPHPPLNSNYYFGHAPYSTSYTRNFSLL